MASAVSRGVTHMPIDDFPFNFPSLGPALLIAMGFIDMGKWVVAIEGGAHFGSSVLVLVLLFNCSSIFCQYLTSYICLVTRKNLAQVCCEEYCREACVMLGLQAEISLIVSDITSIIGVAHGLNLLFRISLVNCINLASAIAIVFPVSLRLLMQGKHKMEMLYICISGTVLLFYVLGILIAQPEVPFVMSGFLPTLSGENSYLFMALLGSNIIVHNFYTQSSMVQIQRRPSNVDVDSLLHDQFFSILFVFSGIFLANSVLLNSGVSMVGNLTLVNFQDVFLLIDQMFNVHISPLAFFLVVLLSSFLGALTWNHGEQVINQVFFSTEPGWVSGACLKLVAIIPVIYYAQFAGADGLYQLLIFCHVMLAMLLPSSVIPVFRVASSKKIMGAFCMSWYLELMALFLFIWMFASNIIFIIELLFGNNNWIFNHSSSLTFSFSILTILGFISLGLTIYMIVTPLNSSNKESEAQFCNWQVQNNRLIIEYNKEDLTSSNNQGSQELIAESAAMRSEKSPIADLDLGIQEVTSDFSKEFYQSSAVQNADSTSMSSVSVDLHDVQVVNNLVIDDAPQISPKAKSSIHDVQVVNNLVIDDAPEISHKPKSSIQDENISIETISYTLGMDDEVWCGDGSKKLQSGSFKPKDVNIDSGPASLSKLSGLGRAARRQFSAILDEYWGHYFDFHGQLTQEAIGNKVDIFLGLNQKTSSTTTDTTESESSKRHLHDTERVPVFFSNPSQERILSNDVSCDSLEGSSWLDDRKLTQIHGESSHASVLENSERRYSSWHLPQYYDGQYHQPATYHGYQLPSCIRTPNARRADLSVLPLDPQINSEFSESSLSNLKDPFNYALEKNMLNSFNFPAFRSPPYSRFARLQDEIDMGNYGNINISEKKYHSSPDISRRADSSRNSFLINRNSRQCGYIGSHMSSRTSEQSQYSNPGYWAEGTPLTFDEVSPSNLKYSFSPDTSSSTDANSLWSRQPFEQLFGMVGLEDSRRHGSCTMETSYADLETKLLQSLKTCVLKLLKLEGSDWLTRDSSGSDEELIDKLFMKERYLDEVRTDVPAHNADYSHQLEEEHNLSKIIAENNVAGANQPNLTSKCGESCIWRESLIVSFGVWCIRRILELSLVESRPELWGKYTYVLNRLQGILEIAFGRPRSPVSPCPCLEIPAAHTIDYDQKNRISFLQNRSKLGGARCTSSAVILDVIKDVESAISGRKGRMGTAAGDVAFPKGKENLASVLKRYKRRLSNKASGTGTNLGGGISDRKATLAVTRGL